MADEGVLPRANAELVRAFASSHDDALDGVGGVLAYLQCVAPTHQSAALRMPAHDTHTAREVPDVPTAEEWHEVAFELGDVGGDGHDKTTQSRILCNIPAAEVLHAYLRACGVLGFALHGSDGWFTKFEDGDLTTERFEVLMAAGFDAALLFGMPAGTQLAPEELAMPMQMEPDMLVALVAWMAKTQAPAMQTAQPPRPETFGLDLGYGLFSL